MAVQVKNTPRMNRLQLCQYTTWPCNKCIYLFNNSVTGIPMLLEATSHISRQTLNMLKHDIHDKRISAPYIVQQQFTDGGYFGIQYFKKLHI